MKEIKAIIQPFMASKVIDALKKRGDLPGITVSEITGFGKARAENTEDKIVEDSIGYVKKIKLEIVVPDRLTEEVVNIIYTNAHTGRPGDGKIFVYTVNEVLKIRTGETGETAI